MLTEKQKMFVETFILERSLQDGSGDQEDFPPDVSDILVARDAFQSATDSASRGLSSLIDNLLSKDHPGLAEIALIVGKIASQMPTGLIGELDKIVANAAGLDGKVPTVGGISATRKYLVDNDAALERCEDNPLGVTLNIRASVSIALEQVERTLSALHSQ
ncbi:hypothetical protein [Candidatus Halocynthiibacter alkanivorans]|uniref:hypothetical protein n=1 Tax=Candidatus Halocynthiibacter alkanivorans TaxID=2267619 RepID=UPI000DF36ABF|nr:hypothetical protein [Candidatus Halocynthiibacter alkanivorans]